MVLWRCSEAYRLQEFYQQTQEQLQARRDALQSSSQPDRPVMDGDVTVMAVKFERSVFALLIMDMQEYGGLKLPKYLQNFNKNEIKRY